MRCRSIIRDVFVTVDRVQDERRRPRKAVVYVFVVRPRVVQNRLLRSRLSLFYESSDEGSHSLGDGIEHEVQRSYSECRALYKQLLSVTDCTHLQSCCCIMGSCPFWTMFPLLKAFPLPSKTLFKYQSKPIVRQRRRAFNMLMSLIFEKFRTYREDYFLERASASASSRSGCKVLGALEEFLHLSEDVVQRFREIDHQVQLKLNLRGWHSDRPNLYFREEELAARVGNGGGCGSGSGGGGGAPPCSQSSQGPPSQKSEASNNAEAADPTDPLEGEDCMSFYDDFTTMTATTTASTRSTTSSGTNRTAMEIEMAIRAR